MPLTPRLAGENGRPSALRCLVRLDPPALISSQMVSNIRWSSPRLSLHARPLAALFEGASAGWHSANPCHLEPMWERHLLVPWRLFSRSTCWHWFMDELNGESLLCSCKREAEVQLRVLASSHSPVRLLKHLHCQLSRQMRGGVRGRPVRIQSRRAGTLDGATAGLSPQGHARSRGRPGW